MSQKIKEFIEFMECCSISKVKEIDKPIFKESFDQVAILNWKINWSYRVLTGIIVIIP